MRLTVPPLEISEDEGFSDEKDIFRRRVFGERLANLIENTDGELVIALDAPWGEGKSTFIKMWRGYLKNKSTDKDSGIHTIYFDAFENDHQKSAFLTLAGEIYNSINDITEKSTFEQKVMSAVKTGGRACLDVGARIISGGSLNGEILENHAKAVFGNEAENAIDKMDKYVSHSLKSVAANKIAIREFKEYLEKLPPKLSYNGKSIVFIIDELDRCKPPFALEIVEIVKHLFSVPNVTFILVMNRNQLEACVTKEYGAVDAAHYLQKFINLWVSLPKNKEPKQSDAKMYLSDCMKRMDMEAKNVQEQEWHEMFSELTTYYSLSPRDIEQSLTNFAFIQTGLEAGSKEPYRWVAAYLSIIKVKYSGVYRKLLNPGITYQELFLQTNLEGLKIDWTQPGETIIESHPLKFILRHCLTEPDKRKLMFHNESSYSRAELRGEPIAEVSKWLDSFRIK